MEQDVDLNTAVVKEAIVTLSEGNPGALSVLIELAKAGGYDIITYMLAFGPSGSGIWVEYKDNCGQDIDKFMEVMRERLSAADLLMAEMKAAAGV